MVTKLNLKEFWNDWDEYDNDDRSIYDPDPVCTAETEIAVLIYVSENGDVYMEDVSDGMGSPHCEYNDVCYSIGSEFRKEYKDLLNEYKNDYIKYGKPGLVFIEGYLYGDVYYSENSEEYYVENFEVKDDHYNIKTHSDYVKHGLQAFYGDSPEDWGTKVN